MAHGLSCSEIFGILLDQGSNACLLHWQVDSFPLSHQGNPIDSHGCLYFLIILTCAVYSDIASLDPDTNNWYLLSFLFLIILARGLSLLSLAKNQLLVSMLFLLKKTFFSISLICAMIFIIFIFYYYYFLFLLLGLICSSYTILLS